jgi:ABC-type nitrate/sulfonate/bicarbonate transport system ATPase subunit
VLVARWLLTEPDILFIDEPTRGIDVGAKAEIHSLITRMAGEGKAIIMVSSEMPEILGMCEPDPDNARRQANGHHRPRRRHAGAHYGICDFYRGRQQPNPTRFNKTGGL